jgi:branched-chain amino acid aminotransferase
MALSNNIRTYFKGTWHQGDLPVMNAADHGAWLGSNVFDGARFFDGLTPDLDAHCARVNRSARALMIEPTVSTQDMVDLVLDGLKGFTKGEAVYIRPMYWAIEGDASAIAPKPGATGF